MPFTVTGFTVTINSITITFSDLVEQISAQSLDNYALFARNSVDFTDSPMATVQQVLDEQPDGSPFNPVATINKGGDSVTIAFTPSAGKKEFQPGDFVHVKVGNIQSSGGENLDNGITGGMVQGRVSRITRDVEDAISYPVLTEEIGYRSSPVGVPTGGGASGSGIGGLGQVAAKAVSEVLGWKPNSADPKGFLGALTQAFTLTDIEGHVESTWSPRTYAVQTDLGGGITGAQASLYMRAKNALDSALPLLDGLYPLDPEADPEYVKALREMARSQMTEIVKEMGTVGLPSILRIDTYFLILLGQNPAEISPSASAQFDPDSIAGTLGELRDIYGIAFGGNKFNNSVEDEQNITNFRVISDYMTSLMQSWIANRSFFKLNGNKPAFFGTQLVLISRQFTTISETVDEVRFALDSVFIGPNERQALLLEFNDPLAPMFLEDVLAEVENFVVDEGPRLLKDGGKISVTNNILPVLDSLQGLINQALAPLNLDELPGGFKTARVSNSLDNLHDQLMALINLIQQVKRGAPLAEDKLRINGVSKPHEEKRGLNFSIYGKAFEPGMDVTITDSSKLNYILDPKHVHFLSAERIDIRELPLSVLHTDTHGITLENPDGDTASLTNAFTLDASKACSAHSGVNRSNKYKRPVTV